MTRIIDDKVVYETTYGPYVICHKGYCSLDEVFRVVDEVRDVVVE